MRGCSCIRFESWCGTRRRDVDMYSSVCPSSLLCRMCALIAGNADSGHSGQVANPLSIEEDDGFDECKSVIV